MGFLRFLAPRIIKSHESPRRSSKNTCANFQNFYPRALSESYKTNGFSTFMLHELARATFARSFNGLRAPARGHNPLQNIPCGTHARVVASSSSSLYNKSLYPCASVVAKVVRMPRSEVSERHRAGSWVWVVAKSRLEIW